MRKRVNVNGLRVLNWAVGLTLAVAIGPVQADFLTVENHSFEQPGTVKQQNWENVPGWSSDTVAVDSGVETSGSPPDGNWRAFLMDNDPAVWQLTAHTISAGESYTLRIAARRGFNSETLKMMLYYDNAGARVEMGSVEIDFSSLPTMFLDYTLMVVANDAPASIGQKLGIEFDHIDSNGSNGWIPMDNVRLERSFVSAINPPDEATLVDIDEDLSWAVVNGWDVDLYFGTEDDPNLRLNPANKKLSQQSAATYDPGTLAFDTTYYWAVDAHEPNTVGTIIRPGPVWSFTTKPLDAPPVVEAGNNIITWLAKAQAGFALAGSVTDDGVSALTIDWDAFELALGGAQTSKVAFTDAADPITTITISDTGTYILGLSATDDIATVSDSVRIDVFTDVCEAAKATAGYQTNLYDVNEDCIVDVLDFRAFAADYLNSTALTDNDTSNNDPVNLPTENALLAEIFQGISGVDPNDLLNDDAYPGSPDLVYFVTGEFRDSASGDSYGQRIRGYIVPPTTDTYTFYIAGDDGCRLFIGSDANPVDTNPALENHVAEVPVENVTDTWTGVDQWDKYPQQASDPVALTAGTFYYVEVLHKENVGGDHVEVGWSTDGGTTIEVIPSSALRFTLP